MTGTISYGHRAALRRVRIPESRRREGEGMAEDQAVDQDEEQREASGAEGEDKSEESQKAQEKEEERQAARERMDEIEEDPPEKLEDWPDDAAKYETFGGPEGEHSYEEGPETKLGPSSLRHHESGAVTIEGEEVDDPDQYKGEPIPGGPTDEDAPQDLTTQKIREDQGRELESEKDGEEGGSDSESGSEARSESDSDSDSGSDDEGKDKDG